MKKELAFLTLKWIFTFKKMLNFYSLHKYKNMKKTLLIIAIFSALNGFSQTTEAEKDLKTQSTDTTQGWKTGGVFGVNFTQVSLSNWAAGGQSSVSLNSLMDLFANYKKGKSTWDNSLNLGYGVVKQGDEDYIKSDDRIQLNSKYGRKATDHWYYAGLFNFKSQFAPGYQFPFQDSVVISDFMAPGYFLGAIGMDYKPSDNFTVFISPVTAKMTVVGRQNLADAGAFGVDAAEFDANGNKTKDGKTTRLEVGGYLRMMYKRDVMKNVTYQTNLDLFSNYSEDPDHIDVNWDNLVTMKVNKYISASVSTTLIYDHDIKITETKSNGDIKTDSFGNPIIGPRTQFKYVIAVGFQYKFGG